MVNAPKDDLARATKGFVFKLRHNILTIEDRARSAEVRAQSRAVKGQGSILSADPQEIQLNLDEARDDKAGKGCG